MECCDRSLRPAQTTVKRLTYNVNACNRARLLSVYDTFHSVATSVGIERSARSDPVRRVCMHS